MPIKDQFDITGYFYEENGHSFRKYLDIRRKGETTDSPDLMAVMMNPGSSRPVSGDLNGRCDAETIPDATQGQIMKLMNAREINWVRVLNLSSLREAKSAILLEKIKQLDHAGIEHSIFTEKCDVLKTYFDESTPVLFAWGVDKRLEALASKACAMLANHEIIGLQKDGLPWAYYHPLPQNWAKQLEWVEKVSANFNACR